MKSLTLNDFAIDAGIAAALAGCGGSRYNRASHSRRAEKRMNVSQYASISFTLLMLAGCNGGVITDGVLSSPSNPTILRESAPSGTVYSANWNTGGVTIYYPRSMSPNQSFLVPFPNTIIVDGAGHVYVASWEVGNPSNIGHVFVYAPGKSSPIRTLKGSKTPLDLMLDPSKIFMC